MTWEEYRDLWNDDDKVCYECGSPDIEEKQTKWFKVNGGECVGDGEHDPDYWCPYCEDHTDTMTLKEWAENNEQEFFKKGVD
jgi:hypothetical protein